MGIRTRRRGLWSLVTLCIEKGYYEHIAQLYLENHLVYYTIKLQPYYILLYTYSKYHICICIEGLNLCLVTRRLSTN